MSNESFLSSDGNHSFSDMTSTSIDVDFHSSTSNPSKTSLKNSDPETLRKSNPRYIEKVLEHRLRFRKSLGEPMKWVQLDHGRDTKRSQWGPNDYLLTCMSGLFGTGNVFRTPRNMGKFGLGPYLFAYLLLSVTMAFPMIFLEISHGQFCGRGPAACWEFARLFSPLGLPMIVYYVVVSLDSVSLLLRVTHLMMLHTTEPDWGVYISQRLQYTNSSSTPSNRSKGEPPELKPLPLTWISVSCYLVSFVIIACSMTPSIATRGKIISKMFLIAMLLLVIYCIGGMFLPGSTDGILFAVTTESSKWTHLASVEMWIDVSQDVFYSNNLIAGYYLTLSSYNNFHSIIPEAAITIVCADLLLSICSIFGTFSYLGFFAHFTGYEMEDIATFEYEELFLYTIPAAVSKTDHSIAMSILFYTLLLCIFYLNITTIFEVIVTAFMDFFNLKDDLRKYVALGSTLILLPPSILMYSSARDYIGYMYEIISDAIGYSSTLMFLLAISWVFGVKQFIRQTECTVGWATTPILASKKAKSFWIITWRYFSPAVCFSIFVISFLRHKHLNHDDHVPEIRIIQGVCFLCLLGKVLLMLLYEARNHGDLRSRLRYLTRPTPKWTPLLSCDEAIVKFGMNLDQLEQDTLSRKKKKKSVKSFKELSSYSPSLDKPKLPRKKDSQKTTGDLRANEIMN